MEGITLKSPSVGGLVKKVMALRPDLSAQDMMAIIRDSLRSQGEAAGDFESVQLIDEARVLEIANSFRHGP